MKYSLDNWRFDKNFSDSERKTVIDIHWAYPDIEPLLQLSPAERRIKVDEGNQQKLQQLIGTGLFDDHEVIGKKNSPRGIKATVSLSQLPSIHDIDIVDHIYIRHIDHAFQRKSRSVSQFYTVKMTVAVEVEGHTSGIQTIEDRFVMVKARSHEEAYQKIESQKESYSKPYLNSKGALVRWVIESLDDCYETDIFSAKDLNNPEGVEVYSKLRGRRYRKWVE
ncbi:DUF4288 domain-containing protein [Mucilaginibacter myungsuensis]|uniref:DUF4288 domain-containing protein n=1 Tax=Mucilaginibacter myungsuensis TaxID=649104 RepID=A0A929PWC6_9SPHI|nr:DUF4288 domain-containing protein [Mucilaginibacter myungsuensis]MBE9661042.1 DUF4288 domain-containing protein [Mucilaginibacter myungsuensis]MDN3597186.1 DUF4288 domain-containing protein [Mucilaginibacter myungsuensis]